MGRPYPAAPRGEGIAGVAANGPLISAFVGFLVAQVAKVFTNWYTEGRWDYGRLVGEWTLGAPASPSYSPPGGSPSCALHATQRTACLEP